MAFRSPGDVGGRRKTFRRSDRKVFRKSATRVHPANFGTAQRGGIRI